MTTIKRCTVDHVDAFHLISWIALIGGIVTYLVGLWNADMQLNEKGYYFAVLVLGL
ncbi:YiaA/YiaB family inner membrane protein, partial [Klebsiella pneumoniae]|uniref:YiaA/YiaB family inner membrane protein n=1 Tax=Klebsiella pneumoniae TaxID=573 RepID=UPI0037457054